MPLDIMLSFAKPYDEENYSADKQDLFPCCDCTKHLMVDKSLVIRLRRVATKKNQNLLFCCHDCADKVHKEEKNDRTIPTEKRMNITYSTDKRDIVEGYDDSYRPNYRLHENGETAQEIVHSFHTDPQLMIEITELGSCPLGRYQECYHIHIQFQNNVWNNYSFIGTLQEAKTLGETKLREFAQQQLEQLQSFLKG